MPRLSTKNLRSKKIKKSKKSNKRNSKKRLRVASRKNTKRTTLRGGSKDKLTYTRTYEEAGVEDLFKIIKDWENAIEEFIKTITEKLEQAKESAGEGTEYKKLEELVKAANEYLNSWSTNTDTKTNTITYTCVKEHSDTFNKLLKDRLYVFDLFSSATPYLSEPQSKYFDDEAVQTGDKLSESLSFGHNNDSQNRENFYGIPDEYKEFVFYLVGVRDKLLEGKVEQL